MLIKEAYAILELSEDATPEEMTSAYRRKALLLHPDKNKGNDTTAAFQELGEAYTLLTNPDSIREDFSTTPCYGAFYQAQTNSSSADLYEAIEKCLAEMRQAAQHRREQYAQGSNEGTKDYFEALEAERKISNALGDIKLIARNSVLTRTCRSGFFNTRRIVHDLSSGLERLDVIRVREILHDALGYSGMQKLQLTDNQINDLLNNTDLRNFVSKLLYYYVWRSNERASFFPRFHRKSKVAKLDATLILMNAVFSADNGLIERAKNSAACSDGRLKSIINSR